MKKPQKDVGFRIDRETNALKDLVELQVCTSSNDFTTSFGLNISLTVGEDYFRPDDIKRRRMSPMWFLLANQPTAEHKPFRVRLLHCRLTYVLSGCRIPIKSKYRHSLQSGNFLTEIEERFKTDNAVKGNASSSAQARIGTTGGSVRLSGNANVETGRSSKEESDGSAKTKPEIAVIEHAPNGWFIGHPLLGDPRQAMNDYCLSGSYFDQTSEGLDHSCKVEFLSEEARLFFVLTVRDGIYVDKPGPDSKRRATSDERIRVVECMRSKLAGILVERELMRAGASTGDNGELLLASILASVTRDSKVPLTQRMPKKRSTRTSRAVRYGRKVTKP
jgi:hypothetical protein